MSETFHQVVSLVAKSQYLVSLHALSKMLDENILLGSIVEGISLGRLVEDYPEYHKGPAVLVLQPDENGLPIHTVWGLPKGKSEPAVLVTVYRPDPDRWSSDFKRRIT
ncbi:DUF4258 domain-containing protein [Ciceribacter sp. L1K23]|uniref:DUF4258 domain-containing protein n=1 Tax=Ciceribacter sp. L1K23 TaxID=2820276 RepID=UPI001B820730|nr:DUF4258 domain-containing protein [Ciceribacter sp. L1K23]MBR0555565.1 DUF4258 domain-containing protein [Ciceribacter sp. L1K23]